MPGYRNDDDWDDEDDFDPDYDEDFYEDEDDERMMFADPGGRSALRAASESNPRDCECPTCHRQDVLTRKDRALGYQCDRCADQAERGF